MPIEKIKDIFGRLSDAVRGEKQEDEDDLQSKSEKAVSRNAYTNPTGAARPDPFFASKLLQNAEKKKTVTPEPLSAKILRGIAPQNEQEIEIEDDLVRKDAKVKVPLKIWQIGKTLGDIRSLDGDRRRAMHIGDRYYEFHVGDVYGSYKSLSLDRNENKRVDFYVRGDDKNSLGLPSLSGDNKIDLMLYSALAERGEGEAGETDNDTKYGEWYYGRRVKDNAMRNESYPWCATFVSWAADKAGIGSSDYNIIDGTVPKYEYCGTGQDLYKSKGRLHKVDDKNDNYKPKAGDTFFVSTLNGREGTGHTGLVLAYDEKNDIVYTIEGNADDKVKVGKKHRTSLHSFGSNGGTKYGIIPKSYDKTYGGVL